MLATAPWRCSTGPASARLLVNEMLGTVRCARRGACQLRVGKEFGRLEETRSAPRPSPPRWPRRDHLEVCAKSNLTQIRPATASWELAAAAARESAGSIGWGPIGCCSGSCATVALCATVGTSATVAIWLRGLRGQRRRGTTHEYAYQLTDGTGVSDILAVNNHQFLVDERDGNGLGAKRANRHRFRGQSEEVAI